MTSPFVTDGLAVITGGASGIGLAAARRAASEGMKIALLDANSDKLGSATDEIGELAGTSNVLSKLIDVADHQAMRGTADEIASRWGAPTWPVA